MTTDEPIREPNQIRQACARKIRVVQVSDHFQAILGCLLGEDWTSPRLLEMVVASDGHLLGRCNGEAEFNAFLGEVDDLIRNIHGVAQVAELDGDEVGYLVAKVADIKRQRCCGSLSHNKESHVSIGAISMTEYIAGGVALAAMFFIASSFLHIGKHPLQVRRLALGIALLLFVAAFALQVANAPPTPGPTDVDDRPKPAPIVATLQQKFEMDFDAYDHPSWPVAIELATCSSNAYLAPVFAEQELKKRGFTDVSTLNFGSSLGYVAMIGDTAAVMFRGTNPPEIQDWLANIKMPRVLVP